MRTHRSGALAAALTISALVVTACGGGATATPAGGGPAASGTPDTGAPSAGTASQPPAAIGSLPIAIPSFDLSQLGGAIPGLDSYRVTFSTDGEEQYQSVVVTQPELAKSITTFKSDGSQDEQFILIGKQVWQSDGNGGWKEIPSALAQGMLLAFDPTILFGAYANANWALGAGDKGVEEKNGIQARHFTIDPGTALGAQLPAGTSVDLWVAEAGHLVALEIVGEDGKGLQVEVSNVNDPSNTVEDPR